MLNVPQKYLINLLAKERERDKEQYAAMVFFNSDKQITITKDVDLFIYMHAELDVLTENLMVSLKDFASVLKTMDWFKISGDKRKVYFEGAGKSITCTNMYTYNEYLGDVSRKNRILSPAGILSGQDMNTIFNLKNQNTIYAHDKKIVLSKDNIHIEVLINHNLILNFRIPNSLIIAFSKHPPGEIAVSYDEHMIYMTGANNPEILYSFFKSIPLFTKEEVISISDFEPLLSFNTDLIKGVYFILNHLTKLTELYIEKGSHNSCNFILKGDYQCTEVVTTLTNNIESRILKINAENFKKALKQLKGLTTTFKINADKKLILIGDTPLPYR